MCAARPGPPFFTLFPLLTRGGIINPTLKTACRDRARFRRDFRPLKIPTRLHFSIHIHFSLYFLVWLYPCPRSRPSPPTSFRLRRVSFLLSAFSRNLRMNVKLTIHGVLASSAVTAFSSVPPPECGGNAPPPPPSSVIQRFDARVQRTPYPFIRGESISRAHFTTAD